LLVTTGKWLLFVSSSIQLPLLSFEAQNPQKTCILSFNSPKTPILSQIKPSFFLGVFLMNLMNENQKPFSRPQGEEGTCFYSL